MSYKDLWVGDGGKDYRMGVYERQRAGGAKPLLDNPTIEEIRSVLGAYQPSSVLEVGCGWGRILHQLAGRYPVVHGCDVSPDMLEKAAGVDGCSVSLCDIASKFLPHISRFDVVFSRGVLHYLADDKDALGRALCNMAGLARKRVVLWERQEVYDVLGSDPHFECRRVTVKDE